MIQKRCRRVLIFLRNILFIGIIILIISIYRGRYIHIAKIPAQMPKNALKFIKFEVEKQLEPLRISRISRLVMLHNTKQRILNLSDFRPIEKDTVILVIHVHKYTRYLKYLIASMSQVKGIQDAFIIFSHSYFDKNVNKLIQSIDFCRVLQIFYPYSLQLFPNQFPGYQAGDCQYNLDIKSAEAINCTGAYTSDIRGRYRNPEQAEKKHSWWWTANTVFENLTCTENHEGLVIFLENDFYVMEDFVYMAIHMKKAANTLNQCEFLYLGPMDVSDYQQNITCRVEVTTWDPKQHSDVVAFDVTVWNSIVSNYDRFCLVDDYSWSQSLFYLSLNRKDGTRYKVMTSLAPRAFKTSSRGFYENFVIPDVLRNVHEVLEIQNKCRDQLFPPYLEMYTNIEQDNDESLMFFDYAINNGGWNDPRDQYLCVNMTISKIKKVIMDMKHDFIGLTFN